MNIKWYAIKARGEHRPSGDDHLGGARTREEALAKAKASYLFGRKGWTLYLVHVPERYGDLVKREEVTE